MREIAVSWPPPLLRSRKENTKKRQSVRSSEKERRKLDSWPTEKERKISTSKDQEKLEILNFELQSVTTTKSVDHWGLFTNLMTPKIKY